MNTVGLVALGGAAGSVLRYLFSKLAADWFGAGFPYGTLGVNLLGSFAAGGLYVLLAERALAPEWRALLMVGVLGGFTTFSAFSLETLVLWRDGNPNTALLNIALNLVLSLTACALGLWLARVSTA